MRNTTFAMTRRRPRRKGVTRLFALGAAFAATAAVGGGVAVPVRAATLQAGASQPGQTVTFDIPEGTIGAVSDAFEAATGFDLTLASDALRDLPSPGVRGRFTPEQALARMLAGTGVGFTLTGDRRVTLDLRTSEFVAVEGLRPRVSSPKFTEVLVDTPQTISVIPAQVFNQQGAQNLTDVLRNTPGITFNAGENGFVSGTSNFSMRGIDTTGNIFVDGARDSGNYFRDTFNVEQVEVVKGPAGDNGRGGAAGYVNMSTKTPLAQNFQRASIGYGLDEYASDNRARATVDVNRRLNDTVALRVNALWQDGGAPGRASAERNNWGLAPSLAFGVGGPTRAVLSYQYVDQQDRPEWGVPGALFDGMIAYSESSGGADNRDKFYGHTDDYDDVRAHAAIGRVEHDFSPRTRFSNQTRWSSTDREALYTVPTGFAAATGLVTTQRQAYRRDNVAVTNFTNLRATVDTGSLRHALSTGVELSHETSSASRYPTNGVLGNPGTTPIGSPNPARPLAGFVGLEPIQTADVTINTVAGYAYDTIDVGPRWQLTGGVRVERYDVALESKTAAGAPQGPDGFDRDDVTVSGKAGVVFKPSPIGSVYASIGLAAQPPASFLSNPDISRDGDNAFPGWSAGQNSASSKVQRATNYEVGSKWNVLDERLSATGALFRTERTNIAMAGTVDGVANQFAGYGEQVVQGVELGLAGSITPSWSIFGGLLLMDSERRHSAAIDAARRAANPADYGTATSTNGDELAFTPNVSANLWTTYRLPFGLTIGGGVRHVGESYLGRPDDAERIIPNGNAGVLPGHTVVNALATFEVNRRLTLRLNVDNLTDRFYPLSANWAGSRVFPGAPRSFLLSTDVSF